MGRIHKSKNGSAQRDSKMSNSGLGEHCHTKSAEHTKDEMFITQIKNKARCFMSGWRNDPMSKMQNVSAQRYSRMSNLKIETENTLP